MSHGEIAHLSDTTGGKLHCRCADQDELFNPCRRCQNSTKADAAVTMNVGTGFTTWNQITGTARAA
jgi:hypothetical protein